MFVDYGIPAFAPAFEILKTKLSLGGFLFVDGWSRPECWETEVEWRSFKEHLEKEPTFLSGTFPREKEYLIALKLGDG